jgi:hypothetical protein
MNESIKFNLISSLADYIRFQVIVYSALSNKQKFTITKFKVCYQHSLTHSLTHSLYPPDIDFHSITLSSINISILMW